LSQIFATEQSSWPNPDDRKEDKEPENPLGFDFFMTTASKIGR
jgi:hypothetical protein